MERSSWKGRGGLGRWFYNIEKVVTGDEEEAGALLVQEADGVLQEAGAEIPGGYQKQLRKEHQVQQQKQVIGTRAGGLRNQLQIQDREDQPGTSPHPHRNRRPPHQNPLPEVRADAEARQGGTPQQGQEHGQEQAVRRDQAPQPQAPQPRRRHLYSPQHSDEVKNSSLEKAETPHSGKNYSFRKAHESHRSGIKKTALEKYVSESLENLELGNKKKLYSSSKQNELKSTLKKQQI